MSDTIRVFVPVGKEPPSRPRSQRAGQRTHVASLVIGLLDNHKHNSGKVLDRLQQRLEQAYAGARFVRMKKPEAGKAAPGKVIEDLSAQCDAVINGIGD